MKIACVQMTSGPDIPVNLAYAETAIREAAEHGAQFVATPENTDFMLADSARKREVAYTADNHPALTRFADLARELNVWILIGSVAVKEGNGNKLKNRSLLFSPQGLAASYDKIHLFDVDLPTGESRRESDLMQPGEHAVIANSPFGTVGLSVCYDMRFPHLFRNYGHKGVSIITVPSAFTVPTGEMHWHVLLRARAIENGAFIVAPAQCGTHDGGRKTYGHSLIINPWGKILAEAGGEPGIIYADIDLNEVMNFRQSIPSLTHDRDFTR